MSFFKTITTASDVCNHDSPTITTKTIFKKSCQFGISIRDVVLLAFGAVFVKSIDAVTKRKKRSVDVCTLNHTDASIISFLSSF